MLQLPRIALLVLGMATASPGWAADPASPTGQPWHAESVTAPTPKKPRIMLLHDMEGLSGQDNPETFRHGSELYSQGQRLLIEDINAVVKGLFDGGAGSVTIVDGHGSGSPKPDVMVEKLDPRAHLLLRDKFFDPYIDLPKPGAFDAVVVVGMHAKHGSGGFAAHTLTIGIEALVNGHSITETELMALTYGHAGIPIIFASGDDKLEAELKTCLPWVHYVRTKKALSSGRAELIPVAQVHEEMTRKARRAVEQLASAKVVTTREPVKVSVRAVPPANMTWIKNMPGINYANETVSFSAPDFVQAYPGMNTLVRAITFSLNTYMNQPFTQLANAKQLENDGRKELFRIWMDAEAGRPLPTKPDPAAAQYNGFR